MRVLARRNGLFGLIRVLEHSRNGDRLYCIDQSLQTMVRHDGVSVFGYVHAIKLLVSSAKTILLIGGAGGSLATMFARQKKRVTVIDIDPAAEELARTYFGLDDCVQWVTADPLSFIQESSVMYDAVIVDACDAEGLVAPFRDPDTLSDIIMRACPKGSLIINLIAEVEQQPPPGYALAEELAASGYATTLYGADDAHDGNWILHVRANREPEMLNVTDIEHRPVQTHRYLRSLRPVYSNSGTKRGSHCG